MIEIIFIIGLFAVLYHIYKVINQDFDVNLAIVLFILQLILLGLFIALTSALKDVKIAIMLKFIVLFSIIEFILFIVEILFHLGYIAKKNIRRY